MGGRNRIVVDYGDMEDLILLSVIDTKTGFELSYEDLVSKYSKYFTIVKRHKIENINNLNELKELEEENREGFVVRFSNGFRVKVKFNEYIRLHGILTNVSNLTVWEHLKNNYDFDELFNRVPDEFYNWLTKTINKLKNEYYYVERQALLEFVRIYHVNNITNRSEFAEEAKLSDYRAILFKLYDKRPYDEIIWKMIRPTYSKPFGDGYKIL